MNWYNDEEDKRKEKRENRREYEQERGLNRKTAERGIGALPTEIDTKHGRKPFHHHLDEE